MRIIDWSSDVCSSDLHAAIVALGDTREQMIDAFVVETEPIDDRAVCRKKEHAGFRIARLWTRRDRADFDTAEDEPRPCVGAAADLVEPGGQHDEIGRATSELPSIMSTPYDAYSVTKTKTQKK